MSVDVLGINIDTYSLQETVEEIRRSVDAKQQIRVVTANPEMIYASGHDPRLKRLINSADIVTADGIGVVWAARRLGTPVQERVTGIDLVQSIFPVANTHRWRLFFLGGKPGVAEKTIQEVALKFPNIVFKGHHGYFSMEEEPRVLENIQGFQPDVLLVGLGAPRQEYWLADHPGLATVCIGVGGSFDALAGIVIRAPKGLQELHLEWLYRLCKEPWRWKRQSVLPRFVIKVLLHKIRWKTP